MSKVGIFAVGLGVFAGLFMSGRQPSDPKVEVVMTAQGIRELHIPRSEDGHFYVHAMVNGQLVRFMVDTGASGIALTMEDARRAGEAFTPGSFVVVGSGASGPVRGQLLQIDSIELGGREISNLEGIVADGLEISLLGQSFLSRTGGIRMNADEMIIQ